MDKHNAHLFLPLVQAFVDGKTIQKNIGLGADELWLNVVGSLSFANNPEDYRIKPEPLECWVNVYDDGGLLLFDDENEARKYANDRVARVAVRMIEAPEQ